MKKLLTLLLVTVLLTGCGSNTLKEGTYEGSAVDTFDGQENTATAKITIDADGKITDVYLDTTYTPEGGKPTTKKTLGKDYGMYGHPYGSQTAEWFEQVEALEQAVIDNQGIDFLNVDEAGYTDAVSTCTIKVDALYKALEDALNKAK